MFPHKFLSTSSLLILREHEVEKANLGAVHYWAIEEWLLCYQRSFSHKCKSQTRMRCYEEIWLHSTQTQFEISFSICRCEERGKFYISSIFLIFYHVARRENDETTSRVNLKIVVHQEKIGSFTQFFFKVNRLWKPKKNLRSQMEENIQLYLVRALGQPYQILLS